MAATSVHDTLTADTVDTVTLEGNKRGFRVQHRGASGTADIWWTWGTTTPADPETDGSVDGSFNLAAGGIDRITDPVDRSNETEIVVKLICGDGVAYSVEAW